MAQDCRERRLYNPRVKDLLASYLFEKLEEWH